MYKDVQTLVYTYLSQFSNAYKTKAPEGEAFPYMIYEAPALDLGEQGTMGIRIYDVGNGYAKIADIVDRIGDTLPINLKHENGIVTLYKGDPFVQDLDEEGVYAVYMNLLIETDFTK